MTNLLKQKQTIYILLLAGIIISFVLRVIFLTQSPPGFFCDESSFGYNAFSIAETGRDEHGVFMPVFFEAFGDYKNPVYVYILVPFVKFLGLSIFSVRFTSAFLGIGSILLFIAFLFAVSRDRNLSLAGGLTMSTMSWHFHFSRVGFEAITFVFFIILAMLFFALFLRKKSSLFYLCFGLASILAFFSYSTGRLIVPILVITAVVIWWKEIFTRRDVILISILCALLFFLILVYDHSLNAEGILSRPARIAAWNGSPNIFESVKRVSWSYLTHLTPQFLFQSGDTNPRHSVGVSSMMPTFLLFPILLGITYFIKNWKSRFSKYILIQLALFPLAASLTIIEEGGHAIRTIQAIPFFTIAATYGFRSLFHYLKSVKFATTIFIAFMLWELTAFYSYYFFVFPNKSANEFNRGMPEAIQTLFSYPASQYFISETVQAHGIEVPFFTKFDPAKYQARVPYSSPVVVIRSQDLEQPKNGTIAVFSREDSIPHFPNERLLNIISYPEQKVRLNEEISKDEYKVIETELYYIYGYR